MATARANPATNNVPPTRGEDTVRVGLQDGSPAGAEEELPEWDFLEESHGLAEQTDYYADRGDNRYQSAEGRKYTGQRCLPGPRHRRRLSLTRIGARVSVFEGIVGSPVSAIECFIIRALWAFP